MEATFLMDPSFQSIILSIISNGLTGLISYSGSGVKHRLNKNSNLKSIIQKVAQNMEINGDLDENVLKEFICSPEVESIVRQIYSTNIVLDDKTEVNSEIDKIKKEFLISFSLFLNLEQDKVLELADNLLNLLIEGCESVLNDAIEDEIIFSHEAKSTFRHHVLLNEINNISKNIEYLSKQKKLDVNSIIEFEEKYRRQVAKRHGYIIPPHFDAVKKLKIEKLYVNPNFEKVARKKDERSIRFDTKEFLSLIHRVVILGNPGGGKSTFADKLCHDLASKYNERLLNNRSLTPIHVVLRDYSIEKKNHNCSILDYIETSAKSIYQLKEVPHGAFEYMLLNGRVIVIFDGLDELLETRHRQEITANVESFCNLYPSIPVIITSRTVGYEQAPLDEDEFKVFNLSSFDDDQIEEYVNKWFETDPDLTKKEKVQKIESFLTESEIVPDLRSNPLMLALMCNIYKGENYIPENRPDVYEKCAKMLFEQWDQRRDIKVSLPFGSHISPAMKHLAYWIYTNEKIQGGVKERDLIEETTEYLYGKRFEIRDDAEKAAADFIEFCKGRAWVFTDTGTTKEGEKLYQFTHQTFLEYFAASQIVRINETTTDLIEILYPRIAKREWDVVAQLAFQIKNRNYEGAGDKLLDSLLLDIENKDFQEAWNLLSFSIRSLEFMVPSPKIIRKIVNVCIERFLAWGMKETKEKSIEFQNEDPSDIIRSIHNISYENRPIFDDEFQRMLISIINGSDEKLSILALEIGLSPLGIKSINEKILNESSDKINQYYPENFGLCYDLFQQKKLTLQEFVKFHGLNAIFKSRTRIIFPNRTPSYLDIFLMRLQYPGTDKIKSIIKSYEEELEFIGEILLDSYPPWINCRNIRFAHYYFRTKDSLKEWSNIELNSNSLFGAFILLGMLIEIDESVARRIYSKKIKIFEVFHYIFIARFFDKVKDENIEIEMENCKFSSRQKKFIWKWIKNEINFCMNPKLRKKIKIRDLREMKS